MTSYLIKSVLCLGLLLVFYHLWLEKEKMHRFNRFFLLGSVVFSMLAPLFVIYVEPTTLGPVPFAAASTDVTEEISVLDWQRILWIVYISGAAILLLRFAKNLIDISLKIVHNEKIQLAGATLVLVDDDILPHTFWKYIFINKQEFQKNEIEDELFTHELTHVTQNHTVDVLFLELLQIVLWFNPMLIWLKKAVQLNHEFLADDKVISSHHNISYYQTLLLNKAAWNNKFYLASNLNYSLTKKRLLMMKTPSSKRSMLLKKLALLPLLVGFVFVFANRVEAQTKKKPVVIEIKENKTSATRAQMKEYTSILDNALKTKDIDMKEVKRLRYLYSLMSDKQKKAVKDFRKVIPPPPPPKEIVIKEVKKAKAPKDKKKMKEVIVIEKTKKSKPGKEPVKEIIIEEVPEVEEKEEVEVIEILHEKKEELHDKKIDQEIELELPKGKNITYYINNKKVSQKKARKLLKSPSKVKSVEVIKTDKSTGKIMITTH